MTNALKTKEENYAGKQAIAQLNSIRGMVAELEAAGDNDDKREKAETRIQEDALSVEIRSEWHTPGSKPGGGQFKILLCTGGPAVQIVGELNEYGEPESATLQYQDWGTPWTNYYLSTENEEVVLTYSRQFYFEE